MSILIPVLGNSLLHCVFRYVNDTLIDFAKEYVKHAYILRGLKSNHFAKTSKAFFWGEGGSGETWGRGFELKMFTLGGCVVTIYL